MITPFWLIATVSPASAVTTMGAAVSCALGVGQLVESDEGTAAGGRIVICAPEPSSYAVPKIAPPAGLAILPSIRS